MRRSVGFITLGLCGLLAATNVYAQAAHGGSVISDPELGDLPSSDASSSDGAIIDDPELAGTGSSTPTPSLDTGSRPAPTSEVHLVLHARGNRDLRQDDPREEIWESTTLFSLDAILRRSDSLRFGLGLVARYHFASLAADLPDAKAERFELDALPTSAYLDATLASGFHVRLGYQPVPLGRMDIFSSVNVLSVADLRDGAATIPGRPEVGQIGMRIDYDPAAWLSLQGVYLPFFVPHIVSVTDSDYALFPGNQANMDTALMAFEDYLSPEELSAALKANLLRGARDRLGTSTLSAFIPEPRLDQPQGALSATIHGTFGELGFIAVTALEHLPTFRLSDAFIAQLANPNGNETPDPNPISVQYSRFAVFSADASIDVQPFQLKFEAAYQMHRAQMAVGTAWENDPYAIPVPGFTDIVQLGGHIEYVEDNTWLMAVEAFALYAVTLPDDPRRGWMFFEAGRFMRGIAGMFGYTADFGLKLQLSAAWLSGPTVVLAPSIGFDIVSRLTIEVGAFIIDGQLPPMFSTPILSIGGILNNLDHVFVGVRGAL
ncbi:MAG: hypothetical protein ABW321_09090 [Polyangiales bacterium]